MGRKYEKNPTYFCKGCHKSFKNQRGLDAHNDALHAPKPVPEEHRLADGDNHRRTDRGNDSVPAVGENDLIIIDESSPFDPKWFDKL